MNTAPSIKAAVYLRVSSEEQRERQTIETQREYAEGYCRLNRIDVYSWYADDGVSGTVPLVRRPEGARLLRDARSGKFGQVLFFKLDRLGRKTRVVLDAFEALDGMNVLLRSMTEPFDATTPSGRLMFNTLANFGSFERETFLERSAAGANRAAAEGRPLGGIALYGYRVVGSKEKARWEIDDTPIWCSKSPADIARWMFNLAGRERWSCHQIAAELNRLRVPTAYERDGRPTKRGTYAMAWSGGSVRNRLVNPCYRGVFLWGRKRGQKSGGVVTGTMPRLVDDGIWYAAQETMRSNRKLPRSGQRRSYLLRGVIRCGICGRNYCGVPGREDVWWYRCSAQIKHPTFESRCASKGIRSSWIEPVVWQDIHEWLRNPGDLLAELQGMNEATVKRASDCGERAALEQVLRDCAAKRERVQRAYIAGDMTDAERARYLTDIEGERTAALEGLLRLDAEAVLDEPQIGTDLLEELRLRLDAGLDLATQQQLVRLLVRQIDVETTAGSDGKKTGQLRVSYRFPANPVAVPTYSGIRE